MGKPLKVNGITHHLDIDASTPLLWVLRDHIGLTGTKFGCGIGQCGACTVQLNGAAVRSCQMAFGSLSNAALEITTIEGLSSTLGSRLQKLWVDMNVAQCGYCQAGMLMAASALLSANPEPSDEDIDAQITNICRCGTYPRVRAAIHAATKPTAKEDRGG